MPLTENLYVCEKCLKDNINNNADALYCYIGYYTILKVPSDCMCVKCHSKLKKMNITKEEFVTVYKISKDRQFLEAMINLKEKDPIEFQLKMSQFKANLSQTQATTEATNKIKCPKCGSTQITAGARGVNHFWGFIGASKTVNRCAKCGHTWKPQN